MKSRAIFKQLLEESGTFSIFDKRSSFDRLLPNQDFLSGQRLGNLIALPLLKPNVEQGNSCFIDPESFAPYESQWEFLKLIKRMKVAELNILYDSVVKNNSNNLNAPPSDNKLVIILDNEVRMNRTGLTSPLIDFIKTNYSVANPDYFIKKKMGRSTLGTEQSFNLILESKNEVVLPRGDYRTITSIL